jgi:hypothetical protein
VAGALIGVAATPALAGSIASTAGPGGARSAAVAGQPADAAPGERPGAAPIVVYLRDAGAGELDIFHGTSHTRLRDPDLARRLAAGIGR